LDLTACPLQSNRANAVFALTRDLVRNTGLPAYGPRTHQGVWRFLVLREGTATGDLMVHCITSGQALERTAKSVDHISKSLLHAHPDITTVVHSVSDRLAQVAFGESERVLHGSGCIRDRLGNRTFEISSGAFFQTNTSQAERLFQAVADAAELEGNERVYDLYCGTGAIGIFLAGRVAEVVGIEAIETAVADARRNAALNGLTNAEFITGDLKDALEDASFRSVFGPPDIVVLDPPRGGTHPDTIREILRLKPPKIVYVSCNPPILARDARTLADAGYRLGTVQPVDMFPHTGHVEVVAVLHSA
jgi:23S rRNA (uracil1939-C5)-methyltransferase